MKITEAIKENTIYFYNQKELAQQEQDLLYADLYKKSLDSIRDSVEMFDEVGIAYSLTNQQGKAVLETEVLSFDEYLEDNNLVLTLYGDYKEEGGKGVNYAYYFLSSEKESYTSNEVFQDQLEFSINYSNRILNILETRTLKEFLNNFGKLYTNPLKK